MKNAFLPMVTKKPDTRFVETDRLVEWVSQERDEDGKPLRSRVPEPRRREFPIFGFLAGGMPYLTPLTLSVWPRSWRHGLFSDIYGKKVLHVKERFPCFDSEDYLHERRHYHWAYLIRKERLICVYWEDENTFVEVTEDVRVIEKEAWEAMMEAGLIRDGILLL